MCEWSFEGSQLGDELGYFFFGRKSIELLVRRFKFKVWY